MTDLRDRLLATGAFLVIAWGSVLFQRAILPGCALLIVLCFVTLTRADPDLWGHVRFGGDIIDSAATLLGVAADGVVGTSLASLLGEETAAAIVATVAGMPATGRTYLPVAAGARRFDATVSSDGRTLLVELEPAPDRD